jgi:hypothetical protein
MVHPSIIEARLGELGFRASRWFNAEIREMERILMDDEKIISLACGRYFGSFALLVATDQRLLLIDKRTFFMTIEDTRYDMISEIDYNSQVYNATVTVYTINKTHKFSSMKYKQELRHLTSYVQRRVMEFRQQPSSALPPIQPEPRLAAVPALQSMPAPTSQAPQPLAALPTDYYASDKPDSRRVLKHHAGHVAHLVGSAAMHASHPAALNHPRHPYIQGSLMTRRPLTSPSDYLA